MGFSAFGAIGAAVGSLLTNKLFGNKGGSTWDYDEARQSMELQKELYQYKYDKELEAMNSAHQREVTDLRNAGLNPILSATGGTGLSSPTGAMPDISSVNSASVAAKQANKQLIVNALTNLADIAVRKEANRINNKSAEASLLDAQANLQNANTNSINTASQVQQRAIQNAKMTTEQKKLMYEMNLINSNIALNSAYSQKAQTDAYVSKQLLPSNISKNYSSGGTTGFLNRNLNQAFDWLSSRYSSAKDYLFGKSK